MIVEFIFLFGYALARTCRLDFLEAYGLDGEQTPRVQRMLLCPSVQFSCCSIFDELKFHKKWYSYHEPKVRMSHDKAVAIYKDLIEPVKFFKNFDWTNRESLVSGEKLGKVKDLIFKLQKIQLDEQLRPLLIDLPKLLDFELKIKKGFVCILCNYANHEYLLAEQSKLMVQKDICKRLVNMYGPFLQKRVKLLNKFLMVAYKVMRYFNTPFYQPKHVGTLLHVLKHKKYVEKCFPKEGVNYDFDNCKELCNKYSVSSLSPAFYGEFSFYMRFMNRFDKFKLFLENKKKDDESKNTAAQSTSKTDAKQTTDSSKKNSTGRLLESRNTKINRKINKISKSLKGYKKTIKSLKRYNNKYLRRIYRNNKKLEQKKKQLVNYNPYFDNRNLYQLYRRNLQTVNPNSPLLTTSVPNNTVLNTQQPIITQPVSSTQQPIINQPISSTQQPIITQPATQTRPSTVTQPVTTNNPNYISPTNLVQPGSLTQLTSSGQQTSQTVASSINLKTTNSTSISTSNSNSSNLNSGSCQQTSDSFHCKNSINVKNSTNILKSNNVTNSANISHSNNISTSFNLYNVTNSTNSLKISNSTNIIDSITGQYLSNVTNCENCKNVTNSVNCTNCQNCTNVYNCTNCINAFNVTNGFNIKNVTNSTAVYSVSNGSLLTNVTDSYNVTLLTNAANMKNASNCTNCANNYNCTEKTCLIPRIEGKELKNKIKEIILRHSEKIVDQLYALYRTGSLSTYNQTKNAFDPQIYRASSLYNDLDRFRYIFDAEGVPLENDIGLSFSNDPTRIKEAALKELLKEKNSEDISIVTENKSDSLRNKLATYTEFDLVYGFNTDLGRGLMSYEYIIGETNEEIQTEDEENTKYEEQIKSDDEPELNVKPVSTKSRKLIHIIKHHRRIKRIIN